MRNTIPRPPEYSMKSCYDDHVLWRWPSGVLTVAIVGPHRPQRQRGVSNLRTEAAPRAQLLLVNIGVVRILKGRALFTKCVALSPALLKGFLLGRCGPTLALACAATKWDSKGLPSAGQCAT